MTDMNKIYTQELDQVTGGISGFTHTADRRVTVSRPGTYHAFKTTPIYNDYDRDALRHKRDYAQVRKNPGSTVYVCPYTDSISSVTRGNDNLLC